jgi:hypothetical protein
MICDELLMSQQLDAKSLDEHPGLSSSRVLQEAWPQKSLICAIWCQETVLQQVHKCDRRLPRSFGSRRGGCCLKDGQRLDHPLLLGRHTFWASKPPLLHTELIQTAK